MADVIRPLGWPATDGFAPGACAAGRVLAVAGQMGTDRDGNLVSRDFVQQFDRAMANVLEVVRAGGGRPQDLVALTVYVTDRMQYLASFEEVAMAWRLRAGEHAPALTLVEVSSLADGDALVEIQALAVLPLG
jgi:enamine deaminase RidA (YjgF/YER057c/UK114 family)